MIHYGTMGLEYSDPRSTTACQSHGVFGTSVVPWQFVIPHIPSSSSLKKHWFHPKKLLCHNIKITSIVKCFFVPACVACGTQHLPCATATNAIAAEVQARQGGPANDVRTWNNNRSVGLVAYIYIYINLCQTLHACHVYIHWPHTLTLQKMNHPMCNMSYMECL